MRPLPLLVLLLTLALVATGLLSPFDGFDGSQLPVPQDDPPVQPPDWAFSIWGLIFVGLVGSAAYGVWRRADDPRWDRARVPLLLSLVIGAAWLFVAERSALWATVLIVPMAAFAIAALLRAPRADRLAFLHPVGLYAGWLTAAAWVAVGSAGAGYGLLTDQNGWAVIGTLGAIAVAVPVMLRRRDATAYAAAVAWALLGLALRNYDAGTWVTPLAEAGVVAMLALAWRGAFLPHAA